jgi:hypothetical protein
MNTGWDWVWRYHRGKIIGAIAGMALMLLIMWLRWWTVPFLLAACLGAIIGSWLFDRRIDIDLSDE